MTKIFQRVLFCNDGRAIFLSLANPQSLELLLLGVTLLNHLHGHVGILEGARIFRLPLKIFYHLFNHWLLNMLREYEFFFRRTATVYREYYL